MSSARRASLLDDLAALAVLALGLALLCWPAVQDGARGLAQYDASFTQIATEHLQDVVMYGASWRDAPLGWPMAYGTAHADWQAGQALLGLPLRWMSVDPSRVALLLSWFGLLATGFAGHRLARVLLGLGPHTWLAGVLCGLSTVAMAHLQHVNLVHHETVLLGALALGGGLVSNRAGLAALGGAALVLSFHFGVYMGVHALAVGVIVVGAAALARQGAARAWGAAAVGAGLAAGSVWPVLSMYREADDWLDTSVAAAEQLDGSWDPARLLAPVGHALLHPGAEDAARIPGNPGYLAIALALVGLLALRHAPLRWTWGAVLAATLLGFALALGPEIQWRGQGLGVPGPFLLLSKLPGFEDLRQPHRWLFVAFVGVALFAAAGLAALLQRAPAPARLPGALLAIAIALGETPRVRTTPLDQTFLPEVYRALGELPVEGAVWEQIARPDRRACGCGDETMMRAALLDRRPLAAVDTARRVPAITELRRKVGVWPTTRATAVLAQIGVVAVVEHPPLASQTPAGWTCWIYGDHRLCTNPQGATGAGYAAPPLYTGLSADTRWVPPLPTRDRVMSNYLAVPPPRR